MLIELKNISKVYNEGEQNEFVALKGVDLQIEKGEFVSIVGPSGSGKSTLMNILGALDVPTRGSYYVHGDNVAQKTSAELAEFRNRDVGFIFQQFNLLARASVLENVLLPTIYGDIAQPELRAKELLMRVGLENKLDNLPNQLSGGQMQRVAIARALIMQPSIVMADEPTGNLDSKTADEIIKLLQELNQEGNTIILITHSPETAKQADRIISIRDGKVV
jgi:putative ABC transport system ATP-binding protein